MPTAHQHSKGNKKSKVAVKIGIGNRQRSVRVIRVLLEVGHGEWMDQLRPPQFVLASNQNASSSAAQRWSPESEPPFDDGDAFCSSLMGVGVGGVAES